VERVTRIELALSAWEAVQYGRSGGLTSEFGCPSGTVIDRQTPLVVAR
jgi:hypothetical protein